MYLIFIHFPFNIYGIKIIIRVPWRPYPYTTSQKKKILVAIPYGDE